MIMINIDRSFFPFLEAVLVHLIPAFHFTPAEEIFWISKNMLTPFTQAPDGSMKHEPHLNAVLSLR
jgi:hypothetical protein